MKKYILLVILGIIPFFLTCTSNQKNQEVDNQTTEPVENTFGYKKLTTKIINKTPDDKLLQVVFDDVLRRLPDDYSSEYETVAKKFNKSQRAIFLIRLLESEVNNGGFNQFYNNLAGQYAGFMPDVLKLVGADKFADLVTRANIEYRKEYEKIENNEDGTKKAFFNSIVKFDDEFYEMYNEENIYQKQVDYIRAHKKDFTK